MTIRLGVIMDPIRSIKIHKDSTFAMLLAAQKRGWELHYMEQGDLSLEDDRCTACTKRLRVSDDGDNWYAFEEEIRLPLHELDVVLMRKDPPFNMDYVYTTYLLELAQQHGALVVNDPRSLRDTNEKLSAAWFPECCPPMLVTSDVNQLRTFLDEQKDIVLKPLDGMGGTSVFRLRPDDVNLSVVLETITDLGHRLAMAQRYLPEITQGDKRILLIDGEPVPYALARIPAAGETRANLAVGGRGEGRELTDRDRWICDRVGPVLRRRGLLFVGLDVIGDSLTEINVTSPTCIRELDRIYNIDIAGRLMDRIESRLTA